MALFIPSLVRFHKNYEQIDWKSIRKKKIGKVFFFCNMMRWARFAYLSASDHSGGGYFLQFTASRCLTLMMKVKPREDVSIFTN
jgi:hypothetical protein